MEKLTNNVTSLQRLRRVYDIRNNAFSNEDRLKLAKLSRWDQRLTLEILKEISGSDNVIEVTGEYSGSFASNGAMHECHLARQDLL